MSLNLDLTDEAVHDLTFPLFSLPSTTPTFQPHQTSPRTTSIPKQILSVLHACAHADPSSRNTRPFLPPLLNSFKALPVTLLLQDVTHDSYCYIA